MMISFFQLVPLHLHPKLLQLVTSTITLILDNLRALTLQRAVSLKTTQALEATKRAMNLTTIQRSQTIQRAVVLINIQRVVIVILNMMIILAIVLVQLALDSVWEKLLVYTQ